MKDPIGSVKIRYDPFKESEMEKTSFSYIQGVINIVTIDTRS